MHSDTKNTQLYKINRHGKMHRPEAVTKTIQPIDRQYIDGNLGVLLDAYLLKSDYHDMLGSRIDTVAMNQHNEPLFIYYAVDGHPDPVNQAIFDLDNINHFKDDLRKSIGSSNHDIGKIKWLEASAVIIATAFSLQQLHILNRLAQGRNIKLFTYQKIENNFVMFSPVALDREPNTQSAIPTQPKVNPPKRTRSNKQAGDDLFQKAVDDLDTDSHKLLVSIDAAIKSLSSAVSSQQKLRHMVYKHRSHFIQMFITPSQGLFKIHLSTDINFKNIKFDKYTVRDIRDKKYTGNIELLIRSVDDYNAVVYLIKNALNIK